MEQMKNKVISILLVAMIIILGAMSISFAKDSLDGMLIAAKTSSSSSSKKGSTTKSCSHKYGGWTTTKSATCTRNGEKARTCSKCGKRETASIPMKSHSYGYLLYTSDAADE